MKTQRFASIALIILLLPCILFITCKKEYSYEGGILPGNSNGTAQYTLLSDGGECASFIVKGNYYTGIATGPGNSVALQVRVDSIGTYSLITNSANGISFSTSGSFTATGVQTILLPASGTPVAVGNFTYFAPKGQGCSFNITFEPEPTLIASYDLLGSPASCINAKVNGLFSAGTALTPAENVALSVHVTGPGAYTINSDTLNGISFSAEGNFSDTGVYTVTLGGAGTPAFPGIVDFTLAGGSSSCTFTVPVQTGPPYATYVLESGFGVPAKCIYTLNGNYATNVPLTAANSLTENVYVTVPGNFTIATGSVNGISFYFTGNFTELGAQTVTLSGTGTPGASGSFTFTPQIVGPHPLGGEACAFIVEVQ